MASGSDPLGTIRVGIAGWSVPAAHRSEESAGSHLQRYAAVFDCVEINSSFYRSHRGATYQRWAQSVPKQFRFSVKLPKLITHELRLDSCSDEVRDFCDAVSELGEKLGAVLVQLPPSLDFDQRNANSLFEQLSQLLHAPVVCEARHPSWFTAAVDRFLGTLSVARVVADPPVCPVQEPASAPVGLSYYRLHGHPKIYYSSYETAYLRALTARLSVAARSAAVWCIFDNTAAGAAWPNALALNRQPGQRPLRRVESCL